MEEGLVNFGLVFSYILIVVAAIGAIALPLISSFDNPAGLKKGLIGLGGIAVLFLIAWAISGDEVTARYVTSGVDAGKSKLVGGALTMMYLLTLVAVIGIIYTEISKVIK